MEETKDVYSFVPSKSLMGQVIEPIIHYLVPKRRYKQTEVSVWRQVSDTVVKYI